MTTKPQTQPQPNKQNNPQNKRVRCIVCGKVTFHSEAKGDKRIFCHCRCLDKLYQRDRELEVAPSVV